MDIKYSKWDNFKLPQLTESDYGLDFPPGTSQVAKELLAFKQCRMKDVTPEMDSAFIHFLRIQQYLFPHIIEPYKDTPNGRIWNNYYLDIIEELCKFKKQILTGPASANKTFTSSLFGLICFLAAPNQTMVMVSTTSGGASERKIWGDIKKLHDEALYEECGIKKIGTKIEYLKAIIFDADKEIYDSKENNRNFRNGMQVVPIAPDSSGQAALSAIQGTKNIFVLWIIDEMAQMQDGVTRPNTNLVGNPYYQFVGIGNANDINDPHGKASMPKGGIDALNVDVDRRWVSARGYNVLFLHGEESPNNHPFVNQESITQISDFPFPYASNRLGAEDAALDAGNGNIEEGKQTVDFWKFHIGFWAPITATNALFTTNLVKNHGASLPHELLVSKENYGGGDFAFSVGGDANTLMHASAGRSPSGKKFINFAPEALSLKVSASSNEEFAKATAREFVRHLNILKIRPINFGADIGNDAAITLNEMSKIAGTYDYYGISSTGRATNSDKYDNKVTELWFQVKDLIKTGLCRGINLQSKYMEQLCKRKYDSLSKNKYKIERKKDMKKRIGRSPDDADAFVYLCAMIIKSGFADEELARVRTIKAEEVDENRVTREESFRELVMRHRGEEDDGVSQLTESNYEDDYEFA